MTSPGFIQTAPDGNIHTEIMEKEIPVKTKGTKNH